MPAAALSRQERLEAIAEELYDASEDIVYFASNVLSQDEHKTGNSKLSKFPVHKRYVREVLKLSATLPRFAIFKSRQMMVTWIICIAILWEAYFKPGSRIAIISLKEEDAGKLIGRIKVIAENLPAHWRVALPKINYYKGKKGIILRAVVVHEGNLESVIQAYPQNGNPGRSETLSLAYWDEVGLCDDAESRQMYGSLRPTLANGGRLIMSSTPPLYPQHFWNRFCSGEYFGDQS